MPRFFFHLYDDLECRDDEGIELSNAADATHAAAVAARNMAAESVREGRLVLNHRIVVCDEDGQELSTVHFGDVVEVLRH